MRWMTGQEICARPYNVVDIFDTQRGYSLVGTCKGHSSFIMHLGWSADGSTLWTNSGDYELLFWNAPKGDQIKSGSDCKAGGLLRTSTRLTVSRRETEIGGPPFARARAAMLIQWSGGRLATTKRVRASV